jgi:hypothetical protein
LHTAEAAPNTNPPKHGPALRTQWFHADTLRRLTNSSR